MNEAVKEAIRTGKTALGIEFGSTRIKAVLVDESHAPIAMGTYDWENRLAVSYTHLTLPTSDLV